MRPTKEPIKAQEYEIVNLEHMLVRPEDIAEYRAVLTERDFVLPFNRAVYRAILNAAKAGAPLDGTFIVAVRQRLESEIPDMPAEVRAAKLGALLRP